MGNEYTIIEQQLKNPKIKIVGLTLDQEISKIAIENYFREQNDCIEDQDTFKIEHIQYLKFKNTHTLYCEVNGSLFKKIMISNKKLFFFWQSCKVFENNKINQCYNCFGFNHSAKKCKNKQVCCFCTGEHPYERCKAQENEKTCVNCKQANGKYKKQFHTNHMANNKKECNSYKYFEEQNLLKIDFSK